MKLFQLRKCVASLLIILWMCLIIYFLLGVLLDSKHTTKLIRRYGPYQGARKSQSQSWKSDQAAFTHTLLQDLGFVSQPRLYPQSYHGDHWSLPVFVTAVTANDLVILPGFLYSMEKYYPDKKLVVYSLDLNKDQKNTIKVDCRCVVREVRWEIYPKHIRQLNLKAYRPLLIQESILEFGAVFWVEPTTRFVSAELYSVQSQTERLGVVAWPLTHPTSTLTHYNMFNYFNTSHQKYFFHRMVEPDRIMLYNTGTIHKKLMLPWLACALDYDCIAPLGSQPHGCNFDHRPRYIYAGCHKYDMSAFNVILGELFHQETPYIAVMDLFVVINHPNKKTWFTPWIS